LDNKLVGPEKQKVEQRAEGPCLLRSLTNLVSEANHGRPDSYRSQMIAMPEFSNEQLLLMGIGSGTYLGFKYKNKPDGKQ